jgi:hypothetical protein
VRRLIKPELASAQDPHFVRKAMIGPLGYGIGVVSAWFSVYAAFLMYMVTPLFYIVPPQARTSTSADSAPPPEDC